MRKTTLSPKRVEKIMSNYDLGKLRKYSYFEKGVEHTSILIITTTGKYVVRLYEKGRTIDFVNFEIELLRTLSQKHFPTPSPIKNRSGEYVLLLGKKLLAIFSYLKGVHIKNPNVNHIRQVGEYLGRLHLFTRDLKPKGAHLRWNASVDTIRKLTDKTINQLKAKKIKNTELVESRITKELTELNFPATLPKGALHADLFRDNVKFSNGKLQGFLDFDDSFYGYLMEDLTTAIVGWCFPDGKFNVNMAREMVRSYIKVRALTREEVRHLYLSLRFMALKFWIYGLNRMEKGKDAQDYRFRRFLSLSQVSGEEFYKSIFRGE